MVNQFAAAFHKYDPAYLRTLLIVQHSHIKIEHLYDIAGLSIQVHANDDQQRYDSLCHATYTADIVDSVIKAGCDISLYVSRSMS